MYAHTYIHTDTDLTSSDEPCSSSAVHSSNLDDESCNPPAAKHQALASFVGSRFLSADCKYNLLVNHFKPGADYSFPKTTSGRAFQYRWLVQFPWLAYSKQENGGFCLPCILFASSEYHGSDPGVLVSRPLTAFAKALELFRKHADKGYHKEAVIGSEEFLKVMTNQQPDIRNRLSQAMADRVASNCQKLASIFKTIALCGRQNIELRDHRDNATDIERDPSDTEPWQFPGTS